MEDVEIEKTKDFLALYCICDELHEETTADGAERILPWHIEAVDNLDHHFYLVKYKKEIAGFVHFNPYGDFWEIHMNILKEFRPLVVEEVSKRVRKMFKEDVGYTKLITIVPTYYKNVMAFVLNRSEEHTSELQSH